MADSSAQGWKEARRLQALRLKKQGWKQTDIAEALGVTDGAVSQWMSRAEEGGRQALRQQKRSGRPARLSDEELHEQLPELLRQGACAHGFRGDIWTRSRVGKIIKKHFGVSYSDGHVGQLLARIGWTRQKPAERPTERDEQAIQRWREERWHELKKSRERRKNDSIRG